MKKISLEKLLEESGQEDYPEQYRYVCRQIEDGKIIPIKSSPPNGKKPALHSGYWLVEEAQDYTEELEELQYGTVLSIRTDYYLKHPERYREERKWVRLLNRYLSAREDDDTFVSLNERSFEIWGREKFLQREQGRKILAHCGVSLESLRVYGTTEPLAYYSYSRRVPQKILIVENKDTFYTMRRYLLEEGKGSHDTDTLPEILGVETGTVIYGAGKGILRSFEDFRFCVEPYINDSRNEILYFGDLDYEGIGIYERLADSLEVTPFVQAYEKMLEKAAERGEDFLPEMSENQNRRLSGSFFRYFPEQVQASMRRILAIGKYIPQEIINIADFR